MKMIEERAEMKGDARREKFKTVGEKRRKNS